MPAYFELLEAESDPAVLAVLGHWLFGYLNPYRDGNGRMARFLMNAMFAAGGYAWTVIAGPYSISASRELTPAAGPSFRTTPWPWQRV
jgi:Fic family protein